MSQTLEQLNAENERRYFESQTWGSFLRSLGVPAALWGYVAFVSYRNWDLGFLNYFNVLAYPAAGLAAVVFTGWFGYVWLGFVTHKTPEQYRPIVHFIGAILLASMTPLIRGDSFAILSHTYTYLEHHGFFALKVAAWGAIVGVIAYAGKKSHSEPAGFPSYPLRWYASLVLGSMIVGSWLLPEHDTSSRFYAYAHDAYYVGPVAAAFIVFHFVTQWPRQDNSSNSQIL